jgi:hypothetical protein
MFAPDSITAKSEARDYLINEHGWSVTDFAKLEAFKCEILLNLNKVKGHDGLHPSVGEIS